MKIKLLMLLAFVLVLPLAAVQAADSVTVAVYDVGKAALVSAGDTLYQFETDGSTPKHYEFRVSIENGQQWNGLSLGFKIASSDGALWRFLPQPAPSYGNTNRKWVTVVAGSRMDPPASVWDFGYLVTDALVDSAGTDDKILLGGIANSGGLPVGAMQYMTAIHFRPLSTSASEQTLSFDSIKVGDAGDWVFSDVGGGTFPPGFGGGLTFKVKSIDMAADDITPIVPRSFGLNQNYPNPFNPTTRISFSVERKTDVNISIFNILGQKVYTLVSGMMDPGVYDKEWPGTDQNGSQVASGIYFYKMTAGEFVQTRKMLLMR